MSTLTKAERLQAIDGRINEWSRAAYEAEIDHEVYQDLGAEEKAIQATIERLKECKRALRSLEKIRERVDAEPEQKQAALVATNGAGE